MTNATSYQEPLTEAELDYMLRKARSERNQFVQVYRILFLLSLLFSYLGAQYRRYDFGPDKFSFTRFFVTFGILVSICTFSIYVVYRSFLKKVQLDVKDKMKTIEGHRIMKKVFVPMKNTYHFYIDSTIRISIPVSAADFSNFQEGDEVFIEFASHSKEYFGYF